MIKVERRNTKKFEVTVSELGSGTIHTVVLNGSAVVFPIDIAVDSFLKTISCPYRLDIYCLYIARHWAEHLFRHVF